MSVRPARFRALVAVFLASFPWTGFIPEANAYVRTNTSDGKMLRWSERSLALAGNSGNNSNLPFGAVWDAVTRGLGRWRSASGDIARFDYWQGDDGKVYEPNSDFNGLSSFYFASRSANPRAFVNRNVIGLTQVWFDTASAEILEADIVLNDLDYRFTTNASDTSQGSGGGNGSTPVFLENVVTHELGHAFGLSHSGGLQSTMLFVESREQAKLSCDDQAGIRETYPGGVERGGILAGQVRTSGGAAVFGAQVVAVSIRRGVALATAVTKSNGEFEISNLEPGEYALYAEPYAAGAASLPEYYGGMNTRVCGGSNFSRTFLTSSTGVFDIYPVHDGERRTVSPITVACASGAAVPSAPLGGTSWGTGPWIGSDSGFAIVDRAVPNATRTYRWAHPGGRVEIHALAFSLYSPVRAQIDLLDPGGSPVTASRSSPVYQSGSGYRNWDSSLNAGDLPPGNYTVTVQSEYVAAGNYPAGSLALDSTPFVVLTGSVGEAGGRYPANARCTPSDQFGSYQSPSGSPRRYSTQGDEGEKKKKGFLGFCGTIASGLPPSPPSSGELVGWFLPFFLIAACLRLRKLPLPASLRGR